MESTIYVIGAIASLLVIWMIIFEVRLRKLFRGKAGDDLEGLIGKINQDINELAKARGEIRRDVEAIRGKMRHHIRGVRTIRFNPFRDSGSNQSFATAFLNDEGDGVVISSIYSRDRVGVYAKPLTNHKSEYELTDEEKRVITESQNHNG